MGEDRELEFLYMASNVTSTARMALTSMCYEGAETASVVAKAFEIAEAFEAEAKRRYDAVMATRPKPSDE